MIKKYSNKTMRYKRELIKIGFSKSGVDVQWELKFHSGRLCTDRINMIYDKDIQLRTIEKCRSLEDVLKFLEGYAYTKKSVKVIDIINRDENNFYKYIKAILDFPLDVKKLNGSVYFGLHEIIFIGKSVRFMYRGIHNDGTYFFTGKFDLLQTVKIILPSLRSDLEFLHALKKIEVTKECPMCKTTSGLNWCCP